MNEVSIRQIANGYIVTDWISSRGTLTFFSTADEAIAFAIELLKETK